MEAIDAYVLVPLKVCWWEVIALCVGEKVLNEDWEDRLELLKSCRLAHDCDYKGVLRVNGKEEDVQLKGFTIKSRPEGSNRPKAVNNLGGVTLRGQSPRDRAVSESGCDGCQGSGRNRLTCQSRFLVLGSGQKVNTR